MSVSSRGRPRCADTVTRRPESRRRRSHGAIASARRRPRLAVSRLGPGHRIPEPATAQPTSICIGDESAALKAPRTFQPEITQSGRRTIDGGRSALWPTVHSEMKHLLQRHARQQQRKDSLPDSLKSHLTFELQTLGCRIQT